MINLKLKNNEAQALVKLIEGFKNISLNSSFQIDDIETYFWIEEMIKKIQRELDKSNK